ncbi:MAG TPA: PilZ domain-containing protein [Myxococcota bacterium]|nr:PilZ domain-containing protein [Myxococcota bacterium]
MSETVSSQTKRRHERITTGISVRLSSIEPERDPWTGRPFFRSMQEICENVSKGGLFVKTAEPFDPGRRVLVEIKLPSGKPLEAIGRVAWVKRTVSANPRQSQAGVGIEFLGGSSEHFEALEAFISNWAQREDDPTR